MAQQKPLDIQPLDVQPVEGELDIQPLDIQPLPSAVEPPVRVNRQPYRQIDRPVADVFNTGIVPPERQGLLPYDPRKIQYPQPLKPATQPPREKSPLEISRQQLETAGRQAFETPILSAKPGVHREIEEISQQYPALGYSLGLGTRFLESLTSPAGIGTAAAAVNPYTGPAVWGLGAASTGHGFWEAMKNWEDPEKRQAGLEEALLGGLGLRFGHFGTSPTAPKPKVKGTDPIPPTAKGGFGTFDTGQPTFRGVPSPEGVKSYFPNLAARVKPKTATTTGTPSQLIAREVPYTLEVPPAAEIPLEAQVTGTGIPSELMAREVPYQVTAPSDIPEAARTGTGTPESLMAREIPYQVEAPVAPPIEAQVTGTRTPGQLIAREVPYQVEAPPTVEVPPTTVTGIPEQITPTSPSQFGPARGTGGWGQIEVPAGFKESAITPKEIAPAMNRKARFLELVQKFEMTGELNAKEYAELAELRKDPEMMRGRSKPFQDIMKRLFTEEEGSLSIDPSEWREGARKLFGGEEPGPETAADYQRNRNLLKVYTDYVKSLTPEERRQRILAGEKLPDFSKTSGRQGQTKGRKVWVDNLTLDAKGNRIGGYVDEPDLVNLADRWNKFTKVTRREPSIEPPIEQPATKLDIESLKEEIPGAKGRLVSEPKKPSLSMMSNEERATEIKKLVPYEQSGSLTAGEQMRLNQLRALNRLTHDAQGNPLAEPGYAPGKADTVEDIANRLKAEPAKAAPTVEPIIETPNLKEAARARKAKEQPIEKKPIQQVSTHEAQSNLMIGAFKQFVSDLPDTLGKHVTRLKDHILGDKPIKPVDGWDSLKGDLRAIRDDPNTPWPIKQKIMGSWKELEAALTRLYTEEAGSVEFGKLWENIRRRKEETVSLPPGWGGTVKLGGKAQPKKAPTVKVNRFGSDIDLGPKEPKNVPNWLRQTQRGWSTARNLQSVDITPLTSAAFRQGLSEIGTGPWLKGLYNSLRAFGSENFDRGVYERIMRDPIAQPRSGGRPSLLKEAGVKFSGLGNYSAMEEMIRGDLSEKIPIYGRWVKASNRAYSAMLNTIRFEKFKKLEKAFGSRDNVPELKKLGELINNTTGQGGLGRVGDKYAELAGEIFYSPRFQASRFHMMRNLVNPKLWYQNPNIARQNLYSALRLASAWVAMAELGAQFVPGAEVSHDPTNPDFMKLKINGKVRMDFSGGVQPIMVLLGKLLSGQTTSSLSGETHELNVEKGPYAPTQYSEIARFGYNKLHPNIRLITDFLSRTPDSKFHVPDRIIQQIAPMASGDVIQAISSGEFENLFPAVLGAPVQSYEKGDEFNEPRFWPPQGREDLDFTLPREY